MRRVFLLAVLAALSFGCARRGAVSTAARTPDATSAPPVASTEPRPSADGAEPLPSGGAADAPTRVEGAQPPPGSEAAPSIASTEFEEGEASWYGDPYHGRRAASGETFDKNKMTAAHRTLPFDTWVRVENRLNNRSVDVRINDRGPFVPGRIIDVSERAAVDLDMIRAGVVPVRVSVIKEPDRAGALSVTPVSGDAFYVVQLGAFRSEERARDLARRMEQKYTGVFVEPPSGESGLYRVRIGRAVLSDARHVQELLRAQDGIEAIVEQVADDD